MSKFDLTKEELEIWVKHSYKVKNLIQEILELQNQVNYNITDYEAFNEN